MLFLKNILKRKANIYVCLLQILFIHNVFSMTCEDMPDRDASFKREINIAYIEDSHTFRRLMSKIIEIYNEQSSSQRINLSLHIHEDDFMAAYSSLELVDHFDIIFTDMQMKETHAGFLVAQHLRNLKYLKPIIVLSTDHEALQEYLKNRNPASSYHAYSHFFSYVTLIHSKLTSDALKNFVHLYVEDQNTVDTSVSYEDKDSLSHDVRFFCDPNKKHFFVSQLLNDPAATLQDAESFGLLARLRGGFIIASKICRTISSCLRGSRAVNPDR